MYILTTCLLLGVLLLTACDRDTLYQEWEGSEQSVVNGTVNSYLNLRIVNGSPNTTRATAAEENAIYDGILIFFVGNGETSAKLKSAVVIDQLINNPGSSNTVNIVQQLPTKISRECLPQNDTILESSIWVGSMQINPMTTGQKQQVPQ